MERKATDTSISQGRAGFRSFVREKRSVAFSITGGVLALLGALLLAKPAYADPHAVFYTDRGQAQLFYNVLAALNQADYVEPPQGNEGSPPIESVRRIGDYIRSGTFLFPLPSPTFSPIYDPLNPKRIIGFTRVPALEPEEREPLPRIRVRQVTSDDGDVFYREALQRRALAEAQRTELANLICGVRRLYYGEEGAKECLKQSQERFLDVFPPR